MNREAQKLTDETKAAPQEFTVEVQRLAWSNMSFTIQASSMMEAREKALMEAGNHVFREHGSSYEVVHSKVVDLEESRALPRERG